MKKFILFILIIACPLMAQEVKTSSPLEPAEIPAYKTFSISMGAGSGIVNGNIFLALRYTYFGLSFRAAVDPKGNKLTQFIAGPLKNIADYGNIYALNLRANYDLFRHITAYVEGGFTALNYTEDLNKPGIVGALPNKSDSPTLFWTSWGVGANAWLSRNILIEIGYNFPFGTTAGIGFGW